MREEWNEDERRLTRTSADVGKEPSIIENVANLEMINTSIPRKD